MITINKQDIDTQRFPNGELRLNGDTIEEIVQDAFVANVQFKYESNGDFIELMFVKKFLDELKSSQSIKTEVIAVDFFYLPYSRMDRQVGNQPFTLSYVADFINSLNFDYVYLNEVHSNVSNRLLSNSASFLHSEEFLPKVKSEIGFDDNEDYIIFPDEGAMARYFKGSLDIKKLLVCTKKRNTETGKIESLELIGSNTGSDNKAIIMDDLSSYGGTFIRTAELLKEQGFKEIYLLVGHAEDAIFEGKLFTAIDKVFTTDSILNTSSKQFKMHEMNNRIKAYKMMDEVAADNENH